MPRFKPVRPLRVSDGVSEQLKQSIIVGHFKAGDRLPPERDLAQEFEVSRVSIREAIRTLENAGFVTTRQGVTGGAFVTELTFDRLTNASLDLFLAGKISIPELYQVRLIVEPEAARLAAERVNDDYARLLEQALADEKLPPPSLHVDIERKTVVHYVLAEMCGNRFLEALVRSMLLLVQQVIEAVDPDPPFIHAPGRHEPIVRAVLSRDPAAAAEAMRSHSIEFGETLIRMEQTYRERKSGG